MKKIIIALLIAMIVPCCIFAARGTFDFTLGVAASSTYSIGGVAETGVKDFSADKLSFGADAELKLAFVAVDGTVMYAPELKNLYGTVSASVALDIFFLRVKAGLGYEYHYNFTENQFDFGNASGSVTEFADFKKACFDVKVGVDVLLGNLTLGAFASLPTATSIDNKAWGDLFASIKENWKSAQLGMVVGISLI